jgi:hypothetical protein
VLLLGTVHARGQYYDPRVEPPKPARYVAVSVAYRDFRPRSDAALINMSGIMPGLIYHQESVDFQIGYMTYELEGESRASIVAITSGSFDLPLSRSPGGGFFLPLLITADYTKAEATGLQRDDFNIGSVGFGAGLAYRAGAERWDFGIRAAAAAQYSFEGFGTGSGFSPVLLADATILLRAVPLLDGVALGYRFRLQTWNMKTDMFDYRSLMHGLFVGVLF